MTINDFQNWLHQNPDQWAKMEDPLWLRQQPAEPVVLALPRIYERFLEQIGPIVLLNSGWVFIGHKEIEEVMSFMRGLNQPEEDISFNHLIPFCNRMANNWFFCFDGDKIVDFDPLDPFSIENEITPNFEVFLDQTLREE